MRLLIADDHRIVLDGLEALLRSAGHTVIARCTDGEEALSAIAAQKPDALVLDVQMPGVDGIEILRRVKAQHLPTRVVLLSASINGAQALEAIRLGTDGLILKEAAAQDLLKCLDTVAAGGQWIGPLAARLALTAAASPGETAGDSPTLTAREMEIVHLVVRGERNKEVARVLKISEGTVKMHLHHVYEKLGVRNRTELAAIARRRGLT